MTGAIHVAAKVLLALSGPGEEKLGLALYGLSLVLLVPISVVLPIVDAQFSISLAALPEGGAWWADFLVGPLLVLLNLLISVILIYVQARGLDRVRARWHQRRREA